MLKPSSVLLIGAAALSACGSDTRSREAAAPSASQARNHELPSKGEPSLAHEARLRARPTSLMPTTVTSFGAAASQGYVYVLGGYFGTTHAYSSEGQSQSFSRMKLDTETWEELPSVGGIQSVTLTAFQGKLYRTGGMRVKNARTEAKNLASVDEFARFDPVSKAWEALPALPKPRSSHAAALVGSKLYVVGGWKLDGGSDSGVFDTTLAVIDLANEPLSWTSLPSPIERRAVAAAASGGHLVVVGGLSPNMNMSGIFVRNTELYLFGGNSAPRATRFCSRQFPGRSLQARPKLARVPAIYEFPARRQSMQTIVSGDVGRRVWSER